MAKLNRLKSRVVKLDNQKPSKISIERITGRALTKIRKRIAERDKYTCQSCGARCVIFEIDHKVPLFMGGSDSDENRQLLCVGCHEEKSLNDIQKQGAG